MFLDILSDDPAIPNYGRDLMDGDVRFVKLVENASYDVGCYNYYDAKNIDFRDEDAPEISAYCTAATNEQYQKLQAAGIVPREPLISEPSVFCTTLKEDFHVIRPNNGSDTIPLDLWLKARLREFTFRVNHIRGGANIISQRGDFSTVASVRYIMTDSIARPSTIVFTNVRVERGSDGYSSLTGSFYSTTPLGTGAESSQFFTMELLSRANYYYYGTWNVVDQIRESLADRAAKLARDGYDILIENDSNHIPDIPSGGGGGGGGGGDDDDGGFKIDVGDWGEPVPVPLN
jgi:hypothetical protein